MSILENYLKSIEHSTPDVEYVDTTKTKWFKTHFETPTKVKEMSEEEYASKLLSEGMLSDTEFQDYENTHNMDWEHIQKVMSVVNEKYDGHNMKKVRLTSKELQELIADFEERRKNEE